MVIVGFWYVEESILPGKSLLVVISGCGGGGDAFRKLREGATSVRREFFEAGLGRIEGRRKARTFSSAKRALALHSSADWTQKTVNFLFFGGLLPRKTNTTRFAGSRPFPCQGEKLAHKSNEGAANATPSTGSYSSISISRVLWPPTKK